MGMLASLCCPNEVERDGAAASADLRLKAFVYKVYLFAQEILQHNTLQEITGERLACKKERKGFSSCVLNTHSFQGKVSQSILQSKNL